MALYDVNIVSYNSDAISGSNDYIYLYAYGYLSVTNVSIVGSVNKGLNIDIKSDYSLFNVSLNSCPSIGCDIQCSKSNSPQFVTLFDNCNNCTTNCLFINDTAYINHDAMKSIEITTNILNQFESIYNYHCVENLNNSMIFDIGYPLYGESIIINNQLSSAICCQGFESCAYVRTLYTSIGNIFCTAEFSCGEVISLWTGDTDNVNNNNNDNSSTTVGIYCMAKDACSTSSLQSAGYIVCAAYNSCNNAELLGGKILYCMYYACSQAIITQFETVYMLQQQQSKVTIYSAGVGRTSVFFAGRNAGDSTSLICSSGDECFVYCGRNSCDSTTTILQCYGKCFVSCSDEYGINNSSVDCVNITVSQSPTTAPTLLPTNSPTDLSNELTSQDVRNWFNWVVGFVLGFIVSIIIAGVADAWYIHPNELFNWVSLAVVGVYCIDFCSDVFFSIELYLLMNDNNMNIYVILFSLSIAFIIIPLTVNLYQLHCELSKWLVDPILIKTECPLWMLTFVKSLYTIAVVTGSSFSAVSLCNSNLFRLRIFSMGLSRFHQKNFQNKRFFSIVLLENLPQMIIQIIILILLITTVADRTKLLITIFSMVFTLISIILNVFEYCLSKKFVHVATSIIFTFNVESNDIIFMNYERYESQFIYKQYELIGAVGKLLSVQSDLVERLKPKLTTNGAMYTFTVAVDSSQHKQIIRSIAKIVKNGQLAKV